MKNKFNIFDIVSIDKDKYTTFVETKECLKKLVDIKDNICQVLAVFETEEGYIYSVSGIKELIPENNLQEYNVLNGRVQQLIDEIAATIPELTIDDHHARSLMVWAWMLNYMIYGISETSHKIARNYIDDIIVAMKAAEPELEKLIEQPSHA